MTIIPVILTFVTFILIGHLCSRRRLERGATQQPVPRKAPDSHPFAGMVGGFQVPENLCYHPGHTWAAREGPSLVRVGMDDFAAKLTGKAEHLTLPRRGQWIRQGQKFCTIHREGASADMVSPMEGSVADINDAVVRDPQLALRDPYGEGWLVTVQSPDANTNFRNLLGGSLARWWTEESASRLHRKVLSHTAALAQDGGIAVDNVGGQVPDQDWAQLAKEFFLS